MPLPSQLNETADLIAALAESFGEIPEAAAGPARQTLATLAERVHALEQALADRSQELEVLQNVQHAINRQLELDKVLQLIADQARLLTNCRSSTVYLLEGEDLRLAVISGDLWPDIHPGYRMPVNASVAGMAIREGRPYLVHNAAGDARVYQDAVQRSGVDSFLIVPLLSGTAPLGIISVANKTAGQLNHEDERVLNLMASSAVISLENARLYASAADAAVMAERNRLARELHDAVTQSLFSASLIGDVLPQLWADNPVEGRRRLEELRLLTRGALAEMRSMLLELRPAALEEAALPDLLRHLANAFTGRTRVPVQLSLAGAADLPVPVKVAVYRIAQEALNNAGRHADPENVLLRLDLRPGRVHLEVVDDGCGFEPAAVPSGHLGLGIMAERAQAIAARLTVNTAPGEGTQITLEWTAQGENAP